MEREPSPEIDDELFNEVYGKAYSGPVAPATNSVTPKADNEKRPLTGDKSDEEDEPPDPNAVPTDFTSREAKVWEAKAKATERNWKKRKEEEMICKICGDPGHFTQGCPSTLGANRRNADCFERVPARDKLVRDLFTEKTISQIEKDVGCKIRMDEKFLFVSGKDRLILAKGVDAVHKIIQEKKGKLSPSSPKRDRSRSPVRNTTEFRPRHSESQRGRSRSPVRSTTEFRSRHSESQRYRSPRNSYSQCPRSPINSHSHRPRSPRNSYSQRSRSPRNASHSQSKGYYDERHLDGRLHDCKLSKGSPQAEASANFGAKDRPAQPKSPRHPPYPDDSRGTHGVNNQYAAAHMPSNWCIERHGADSHSGLKFDMPSHQQTLEELEMEFKREAAELVKACDQKEDEENNRHQEALRVMRENYMERITAMRNMHARKREDFLQLTIKRQQAQTSYTQIGHPDFEQRPTHISSTHQSVEKSAYPYASDSYSAPRANAAYGEFQHERQDDFGRPYRRY